MKDIWAKAKDNQEILHFKNFQHPEISWGDVLNFIYDLASTPSKHMIERSAKGGGVTFGITILTNHGYFWIEKNNLFEDFKGLTELMEKVNGGYSGKDCIHYSKMPGHCDCDIKWHVQTLRFVIGNNFVAKHKDPNDVLYWQVLGTSYWKMNNDKEYKLEPGDLLYFNKDDDHEVWQDGPRAGIIIDSIKDKIK